MKIRRNFPPLAGISVLAVILITSLASTQPASALAPESGPSARGAGDISLPQSETIRYSFDVRSNRDGHASGLAEFDNLTDGTDVVVKVKCLEVNSVDAVMTGFVLHSSDPNFPLHSNVIFGAADTDSIPEVGADFITLISLFPAGDCHSGVTPMPRIKQLPDAIQIEP